MDTRETAIVGGIGFLSGVASLGILYYAIFRSRLPLEVKREVQRQAPSIVDEAIRSEPTIGPMLAPFRALGVRFVSTLAADLAANAVRNSLP